MAAAVRGKQREQEGEDQEKGTEIGGEKVQHFTGGRREGGGGRGGGGRGGWSG